MIQTLFASPCAISGSVWRYWYASSSASGLPSWMALKTVSIAFACPSDLRIAACFSPSAERIAACFWPSAMRICDWRAPSACRIVARFSRSARICFSIES